MPRVVIPLQSLPGNGGGIDELLFTAADADDDHYFDNSSGKVLLIAKNDHTDDAAITILSVADEYGRTGDENVTCPKDGGISVYGPFATHLWNQRAAADLGHVHFDVTDGTDLLFAAVKLP